MREAFASLALREVDQLVRSIEELQLTQAEHVAKHLVTVAALNDASDKFRTTVAHFTDQAKEELKTFLQRKAHEAAAATIETQRELLLQAVRQVVQREAEHASLAMREAAGKVRNEFKRQRMTRLLELCAGSVLTALIVVVSLRVLA
ncbi:hypothetical protein ACVNIS_24860 (plasmid) [Sphaerotilaceae bacterium SBD11-9]